MTPRLGCWLCVTVQPESSPLIQEQAVGLLCPWCFNTLLTTLRDIARWHAHLRSGDHLITTRDRDAERWVGSKSPVDCHVLSVLDRRSRHLSKGDPLSAERLLRTWLYWVLETIRPGAWQHDHPLPALPVSNLVIILIQSLPWLTEQSEVIQFARHMSAARRQLTSLIANH